MASGSVFCASARGRMVAAAGAIATVAVAALTATSTAAVSCDKVAATSGCLRSGLYEQDVKVTKGGSSPSPLTISNYPGELSWPPPALSNPTTLTVPALGGSLTLDVNTDYILQAPNVITNSVTISGGRNIVWIGGEFRFPTPGSNRPAVKFIQNAGNGGTIHLEGLWIDGSNGNINDGIVGGQHASRSEPTGTLATTKLQVQDVRATIRGDWNTGHPDCIQQYGGWAELRIDRLTCSTEGQGLFLPWEDTASNNHGVLPRYDARHVNLSDAPSNAPVTSRSLIHFGSRGGSFDATTHQMTCNQQDFWITDNVRSFNSNTYPNSGTSSSDGTVVRSVLAPDGLSTSWATTWDCPGRVDKGVPPGGDFVPEGVAGLGYVSPGWTLAAGGTPQPPSTGPGPAPGSQPEPEPVPGPQPGVDKPPKVKVKSPRQGVRFTRTLKILADAGDDHGIARVDLYVDSRLVDRDTRAPYQETWAVPKRLSYGSHSVTAKAYDGAGQSEAHSVAVTRVKSTKARANSKRGKRRAKRR